MLFDGDTLVRKCAAQGIAEELRQVGHCDYAASTAVGPHDLLSGAQQTSIVVVDQISRRRFRECVTNPGWALAASRLVC
jgi:hypothetical protein